MVRRALIPLGSAVMAALGGAAGSGLLASDAVAQVARRDEEEDAPPLLVVQASQKAPILLAGHRSHRSHSSHSSHSSHYSSRGGGGGYSSGGGGGGSFDDSGAISRPDPPPVREPPPPPPKPARVSFVAYPGGRIFLDEKPIGRDVTSTLVLRPGRYLIRVENKFVGDHKQWFVLEDGQTGQIEILW